MGEWRGAVIDGLDELQALQQQAVHAADETLRSAREGFAEAGTGVEFLRWLKFDRGRPSPCEAGRMLTAIEQANQVMTWLVSLAGVGVLLQRHPDSVPFRACYPAQGGPDIAGDGVRAEAFATKDDHVVLRLDSEGQRLHAIPEAAHKYIFFCAPGFPETQRIDALCMDEIEVWSVCIGA